MKDRYRILHGKFSGHPDVWYIIRDDDMLICIHPCGHHDTEFHPGIFNEPFRHLYGCTDRVMTELSYGKSIDEVPLGQKFKDILKEAIGMTK